MSNNRPDKFKVGDSVMRVKNEEGDADYDVGAVATIVRCDEDGFPWVDCSSERDPEGMDCVNDRDWELEHIANSPLYKALA